MNLYTLSELLQLIKEDCGLNDLPLPEFASDNALLSRLQRSAMKDFSILYPRFLEVRFGDEWIYQEPDEHLNTRTGITYQIPKYIYDGAILLGCSRVDPISTAAGNDSYFPSVASYSPDQVMMTIADVQLASEIGAQMSKAMTWKIIHPNKIKLYNGWMAGKYEAELLLTHDDSLATVPPTAMPDLRQLATLDIEQYLYQKFKRIQGLDVGVGTFELKVDDWQDAGSRKEDLLRDWREKANLDIDYIQFW